LRILNQPWCSAAELDERTRFAAARLAAVGIGAGDRVVWSTATSLDAVVACLGALRLGAVVVPVNPRYSEHELTHVLTDVRPRGAVVERTDQAGWVRASVPEAAVLTPALEPRRAALPGRTQDGTPLTLDSAGPRDPALIVYTSGTTGAPKGAVLDHGNLLAGAATLGLAWRWEPEDCLVLALPLFHVHGLCAGLFGTLASGASAVLVEYFDADTVLEACGAGGTLFFGVPTMYHRFVALSSVGELARLRLCVSGSAPLASALWHRVQELAGVCVLERYGMTETLLTISNPYEGERRPGTVGFPLPGVEVRLEPEGEGELVVRGPSVFAGYWERPAATADAFAEGWFKTGDIVAADADGYLSIRGRRGDLIISGGFNVYPAEVEDALLGHPGVLEVAVTGTESAEWGQEVTAWVVASGDAPSSDELLAFGAERLAPYKRPRTVRFVDALPRNAMGKVQRADLA
jgi:malonyl-CoA/methylmalonyl-CoA synthetase